MTLFCATFLRQFSIPFHYTCFPLCRCLRVINNRLRHKINENSLRCIQVILSSVSTGERNFHMRWNDWHQEHTPFCVLSYVCLNLSSPPSLAPFLQHLNLGGSSKLVLKNTKIILFFVCVPPFFPICKEPCRIIKGP